MALTARAMQQYGPYMHDRQGWGHPWLVVVFLVLLAAAIGFGVWALVHSSRPQYLAHPMAPPGSQPDPALEVLRMRFAQGEIDAAEYAARAAQLQGTPPPSTPAP